MSPARDIGETGENPLERFPTDRANFPENIEDANTKKYILIIGPCKPKGILFPLDKLRNRFSEVITIAPTKLG